MRISDWSSDVCSSDLVEPQVSGHRRLPEHVPPGRRQAWWAGRAGVPGFPPEEPAGEASRESRTPRPEVAAGRGAAGLGLETLHPPRLRMRLSRRPSQPPAPASGVSPSTTSPPAKPEVRWYTSSPSPPPRTAFAILAAPGAP